MEILALLAMGLAIGAFLQIKGTRQRIEQLDREVHRLSREVNDLSAKLRESGEVLSESHAEAPARETFQEQKTAPPPPAESPVTLSEPPPLPAALVLPRPAPADAKSIEETLTSRWLVWVGALAIALAGAFLVRYAIENGLLGPTARVTLGFLLGIVLIVAGEWLRRRPLERAIAAVRTNHVPPALTASGLFIAFASIYAAYALYNLLVPVAAFAGLALVALGGVGLSLLQGRFVAILGLLGAFVAPALIVTPNPSAWNLFAYLLVVEFACLAVARYEGWWWLALVTLAGAMAWPLLWMLGRQVIADGLPLGLFLLLTVIGFFALRRGAPEPEGQEDWIKEVQNLAMPEWVVWLAAIAVGVVQFAVLDWSAYSAPALIFSGILAALYIGAGRRVQVFDSLAVAAAVLALGVAAAMPGPRDAFALHAARPDAVAMERFDIALMGFGILFGLSGFFGLWGAKRPALWAAISAATPVLLLIIAYYRLTEFRIDPSWAVMALALAAVAGVAAERIERYRIARGLENALAFYAAAVVALVSLSATMIVREAWLTVALSIQLPLLAWINTRLRVRSLEIIAAIVAVNVLVRLVLNYNVFGYPLAASPALSWVVYGYGVPALAFHVAGRLFRTAGAQRIVSLLEAGALAFAVLLVSLEIRLFVAGSLSAPSYGLLEESLQTIAWAAIGSALAVWTRRSGDRVLFYGSMLLLGAAAAQVVLLQLLVSNPLLSPSNVGAWPVLNVLFLAYALPAFFALRFAATYEKTNELPLTQAAAALGFVLVFAYLTLETTRAFEGPVFGNDRSDAELYAWSIVWLVYALALLTLGIVLAKSALRYASLGVLIVTVLKVFLFDMAGLTGLYRVGSFLGLGLSLIAIGFVYQRFVFPSPAVRD
jgi:uncharacterized membrane protein